MKTRKKEIIFIYPSFYINRILFSIAPCIFINKPALQVLFLLVEQTAYICVLIKIKANIIPIQYYLDVLNEIMLFVMYVLLLFFIDGGLIYGSQANVPIQSQIDSMSNVSTIFVVFGILTISANFLVLIFFASNSVKLYFKRFYNIHEAKQNKLKKINENLLIKK